MVAPIPRPAHQVGHHGHGQCRRHVGDPVDFAAGDGGVDHRGGLLVDVVADGTQRPGQHPVGHQLAAPVVVGPVTVECGALAEVIRERIERDALAGD